jgi:hypothetical protein
MKSRMLVALVALIAVGAFFVGRSFSDDKKMEGMQMTEEQKAQYAEIMKYAMPDDHHKALEPFVGNWEVTAKNWMESGAAPNESKGTSESKWLLDGRYLQEVFASDMMGMPYNGFGLTGYDLIKKEYVSIWMDDMSTAPMFMHGQMDVGGKVMTTEGSYPDVTKNMKECSLRVVSKIVSNDQHTMEMFMIGDDGKEFKNMEITYTRTK